MRESLLTIPVNEILEPKCGCPICRMRDMLEQRTVEYIMGAAMMEPDYRIISNEKGYCNRHYSMMLPKKEKLSLAYNRGNGLAFLQNANNCLQKLI